MSKTLKLEISVADLGQNGVVVSEFATTDYVANELSKKATLNDEGKVDPSLLPDYTYVDGLVDKLDDVEQSLLNSDAEILNAAKLYSDNKISENNSKKADLVEGKVPFEQLPFSMNFEQNVSTEFENVREELRQNSESIVAQMDGLVGSANSYTDGKVLEEREFLNNTINEYKGEVNSQLNNFGNEVDDILKSGASLPYDPDLEYVEGALTLKDGEIQQFVEGVWVPFKKTVDASDVKDESGLSQQALNNKFKTYSNFYVFPENFYNPVDGEDWYNAIQAAVDTRLPVQLAGKSYKVSKAISVYDNTILRGCGKDVTFIEKTTSETSSNGKDAIVYLNPLYSPWTPTVRKIDLNGLKLTRTNPNVGFGLYGDGLCLSTIQNFDVDGCRDGIHIIDSWQNVWIQCTASHGKPWFMERGTSNSFISCWSTDVSGDAEYGAPCYAWDIGGEGHTLIGCWADRVGTDGSPADAAWNFTRGSNITAVTLGGEILHVKKLMNVSETSVKIGNLFTWQFFNKYGSSARYGNFEVYNGGSLDIQGGKIESEYTPATIPAGNIKPIFATIRNSGVLTIGQVELTDKITGVGDGSATQIDHDGTGTIDIQGQTKYWESGNPTQRTVSDSFGGKAGNNVKSIHSIDKVSIGKFGTSNTPVINMHSAGKEGFVNARIMAYGGSDTQLGTLGITADVLESTARVNYFTGDMQATGTYNSTTAAAPNLTIASNGLISRSTSSKRFKKDILDVDIETSKSIISQARPIKYKSTSDVDNPNYSYYGLIAEEVSKIDKRLVFWGKSESGVEIEDGVSYERFIPHLINVVKDLQRQLNDINDEKT